MSRVTRERFSEYIMKRLKLLESLLLELHDVDNRLKMELLSLNSMIDADLGEGNASGAEDSQFLSNSVSPEFLNANLVYANCRFSFGPSS